MLCSCHFGKTEWNIMIFINFQVYYRNEKNFESSYGLGGRHLKIRDVCMDLEPFDEFDESIGRLQTPFPCFLVYRTMMPSA